jgi:hypothetical protein
VSEQRYSEDDRVADVETGALGTVVGTPMILSEQGYQRACLVEWDEDASMDLRRADTLRPAADDLTT